MMSARQITRIIQLAIEDSRETEFSPINEYDIIEACIQKVLEHPMCPKCGCQKLRGDCGHVWEIL